MSGFTIEKATDGDAETIARLADEIWHEHYKNILSPEQIDYMVEKFQSLSAIRGSVASGYEYRLVRDKYGNAVGYFGVVSEGSDTLFLSKLYIRAAARGNGIGVACIKECEKIALQRGLKKIRLTVNRKNPSFGFYSACAFSVVREEDTDIGNGFEMNDYVMEKAVTHE